MVLIADSGSTKADWVLIGADNQCRYQNTVGFNPVVHPPGVLRGALQTLEKEMGHEPVTEVHYYGAGCWDVRRKKVIDECLKDLWPAAEISVMHDLLGAARATCGHDPGVACILGTGSNTCLYDGTDVIDNVTNLGFMLGDEGSGSHLGKAFLRAYFYRELDDDIHAAFENYARVDRASVIDTIYESDMPNTYLASFTRFMGDHKSHPLVQRIIFDSFAEFLDRHVRKYRGHLELPVHFIGSIAFHFQDILLAALHERNLTPGNFIHKPIEALANFHQ